ncbi:MAG: signal peptidase I [Clostridia bacterium]|nr:signal peptidase I [Clostridia bacterium]
MGNNSKKEDKRNYGAAGVFYDAVSIIITAIMLLCLVFTFCCRMVGVDGTSMNDTLVDGDWLVVTPYYTEPKRGDIVIATKETAARGPLVKRVIGLPGDEIDIDENDNVYVNGIKLDEPYALPGSLKGDRTYPVTVPDGCVMLMGDNRMVSWDSRYTNIGFIEKEYLLGKAQLRLEKDWNIYSNYNK